MTILQWTNRYTTLSPQLRNIKQNHSPGHQTVTKRLKYEMRQSTTSKLYFIDYNLPVILYTDTSDYAHGAYHCQIRQLTDGTSIEEPIQFLGGAFQGPQVRWSTVEKEAYAIYWALLKLDELVWGFIILYVRTTATYFLS